MLLQLVIPGLLDGARVARMTAALGERGLSASPANDPGKSRFQFLDLGADFHSLIDHPRILPLLKEVIGPKLRVDHAYGMLMSTDGEPGGEGLHHEGGMFDHGCFYVNHGERIHNGLVRGGKPRVAWPPI